MLGIQSSRVEEAKDAEPSLAARSTTVDIKSGANGMDGSSGNTASGDFLTTGPLFDEATVLQPTVLSIIRQAAWAIAGETIDANSSLFAIGIDSIVSVAFAKCLTRRLGGAVVVTTADIGNSADARSLAAKLAFRIAVHQRHEPTTLSNGAICATSINEDIQPGKPVGGKLEVASAVTAGTVAAAGAARTSAYRQQLFRALQPLEGLRGALILHVVLEQVGTRRNTLLGEFGFVSSGLESYDFLLLVSGMIVMAQLQAERPSLTSFKESYLASSSPSPSSAKQPRKQVNAYKSVAWRFLCAVLKFWNRTIFQKVLPLYYICLALTYIAATALKRERVGSIASLTPTVGAKVLDDQAKGRYLVTDGGQVLLYATGMQGFLGAGGSVVDAYEPFLFVTPIVLFLIFVPFVAPVVRLVNRFAGIAAAVILVVAWVAFLFCEHYLEDGYIASVAPTTAAGGVSVAAARNLQYTTSTHRRLLFFWPCLGVAGMLFGQAIAKVVEARQSYDHDHDHDQNEDAAASRNVSISVYAGCGWNRVWGVTADAAALGLVLFSFGIYHPSLSATTSPFNVTQSSPVVTGVGESQTVVNATASTTGLQAAQSWSAYISFAIVPTQLLFGGLLAFGLCAGSGICSYALRQNPLAFCGKLVW